jgi:hypothetical protein
MAAPQFKAVLIATQMRSESGLTFRSKQSAVWPADPLGRRGCCEPAGKTCYLPRFYIMHRSAMLPVKDRRSCGENARKQSDPCADFVCLELPRVRTLGRNQYVELEIKKAKVNGTASKLPAAQKPVTRWPRPSSWTGASADKQWRFAPIPIAASIIPTHPLRSRSKGGPGFPDADAKISVGAPSLRFFARAGTTDAWYGVSGMTIANP